ncbi:MAG: methionine adenosyltransferase domain-containing protein [Rhizobacter sp.]|nr:methionine adenosyltransferase domain-containing protein [Rhizobacter sp.]
MLVSTRNDEGPSWSGKDFDKPDRVGGMLARKLALEAVQRGLGRRAGVQLEYRPNSDRPASVAVEIDGRRLEEGRLSTALATRVNAMAAVQNLQNSGNFKPLCDGDLARWGHFGTGLDWER